MRMDDYCKAGFGKVQRVKHGFKMFRGWTTK
jgi:hypothetical protein